MKGAKGCEYTKRCRVVCFKMVERMDFILCAFYHLHMLMHRPTGVAMGHTWKCKGCDSPAVFWGARSTRGPLNPPLSLEQQTHPLPLMLVLVWYR